MTTTQNADGSQIIEIGDIVTIRESDAPEYTARVVAIQPDENFCDAVSVQRRERKPHWINQYRIVGKAVCAIHGVNPCAACAYDKR